MKKIFLMATMVSLLGMSALAQETKAKKLELGVELGMTTLTNYSALSLFEDATPGYSTGNTGIHFGYRHNDAMIGLKVSVANFNTSAIALNEQGGPIDLLLMSRYYAPINEHFEAFFGANFGATAWVNSFTYLDKDYSQVRWGVRGEFEVGVNYKFDSRSYFGISAGIHASSTVLSKNIVLPAGLVANRKDAFEGYTLSIHYGVRF